MHENTDERSKMLATLAISARYHGITAEQIREAVVKWGLSAAEEIVLKREGLYHQKEHSNALFLIEAMLDKTAPTYKQLNRPLPMSIELAASFRSGSEEENLAQIYYGISSTIKHPTLTGYLVEIFIRISRCICGADAETLRDRMLHLLVGRGLPDMMHLDGDMLDFMEGKVSNPSKCVRSAGTKLVFIREALKNYPGGMQMLYDRWSEHTWFREAFAELIIFGYDYPAIPAPKSIFIPPGVSFVWLPDRQMYVYATQSVRACGSS